MKRPGPTARLAIGDLTFLRDHETEDQRAPRECLKGYPPDKGRLEIKNESTAILLEFQIRPRLERIVHARGDGSRNRGWNSGLIDPGT
jgi:hypothetical protein